LDNLFQQIHFYQQALSFFDCSNFTNHLQHVLIIIDANPNIKGIKSFANITINTYFTNEQEVLFMLG